MIVIKNAEKPDAVSPPGFATTLKFPALANPPASISVMYTIMQPLNVNFANHTKVVRLDKWDLTPETDDVPKDVSFEFGDAEPEGEVIVTGSVRDSQGQWLRDVTWSVPIKVELNDAPGGAANFMAPSLDSGHSHFEQAVMARLDHIAGLLAHLPPTSAKAGKPRGRKAR